MTRFEVTEGTERFDMLGMVSYYCAAVALSRRDIGLDFETRVLSHSPSSDRQTDRRTDRRTPDDSRQRLGKESRGKNAIITIRGPVICLSTSRHQNVAEWHLLDCAVTPYEQVSRQQLFKRRLHNLQRAVNKPAFSWRLQRQTNHQL